MSAKQTIEKPPVASVGSSDWLGVLMAALARAENDKNGARLADYAPQIRQLLDCAKEWQKKWEGRADAYDALWNQACLWKEDAARLDWIAEQHAREAKSMDTDVEGEVLLMTWDAAGCCHPIIHHGPNFRDAVDQAMRAPNNPAQTPEGQRPGGCL